MSNYRDTVEQWSTAIREGGELPGRAEVYRELVHASISGLLQTNLPRTHALMGDDEWHKAIQQFLASRTQHSPHFVDLAAEFAAQLNTQAKISDLAHYEALCLEVETTRDEDTRRLAAYEHNVLLDPPVPAVTFILLDRNAADGTVRPQEISASQYVHIAKTVI